jgi:hypothetical protein
MKLPPLPRIGPCRDPLRLWFLEFAESDGRRLRRYFADRNEARVALRTYREQHPRQAILKTGAADV